MKNIGIDKKRFWEGLSISVILLILISTYPFTVFAGVHPPLEEDMEKRPEIQQIVDWYNANINRMPDVIKTVMGTERIKAYITFMDGSKTVIGLETKDGLITKVSKEPYDDSTMALYVSEWVIKGIMNSPDPFTTLKEAWGKEIRYEGLTLGNKVKVFLIDVAFKIVSIISFFIPPPLESLRGVLGENLVDAGPGTVGVGHFGCRYEYDLVKGGICTGPCPNEQICVPITNGVPGQVLGCTCAEAQSCMYDYSKDKCVGPCPENAICTEIYKRFCKCIKPEPEPEKCRYDREKDSCIGVCPEDEQCRMTMWKYCSCIGKCSFNKELGACDGWCEKGEKCRFLDTNICGCIKPKILKKVEGVKFTRDWFGWVTGSTFFNVIKGGQVKKDWDSLCIELDVEETRCKTLCYRVKIPGVPEREGYIGHTLIAWGVQPGGPVKVQRVCFFNKGPLSTFEFKPGQGKIEIFDCKPGIAEILETFEFTVVE